MIVGFTGTQEGMTKKQRRTFRHELAYLNVHTLHHGDCVGADQQAHNTARKRFGAKIIVHPPDNDSKRAFVKGQAWTHKSLPYLERNKNIVNQTRYLIATPKEDVEQLRSGTWSTIRYARKIKRPHSIVYSDGRLERVKGKNKELI